MLAKQSNIKQKNKKEDFFGMLLATLGASLLGNLLTGISTIRAKRATITVDENI